MLVIGAKGHAKEIAGVLAEQGQVDKIAFYDDISVDLDSYLFGKFKILRKENEARAVLAADPRFVLGIGNPMHRKQLAEKFTSWGGELTSVISVQASIG